MTREEAIKELKEDKMLYETDVCHAGDGTPDGRLLEALDMAIEALQADAISREDGDMLLVDLNAENGYMLDGKYKVNGCKDLTEQGWRIGKPTEQGEYMVTIDSFGHKHIDLFYYGKPLMPNRKVRGKCWYRSDDEWGDVVYDDTDILAWQPLPKPYKGGDSE